MSKAKEDQPVKNIYQKIIDVMGEIDYIQKGEKKAIIGPQQYRFVSHDQVTAAIHPLLFKHRIAVLTSVVSSKQDGNRTEVTLSVKFVNADNPQDYIESMYLGYGIDSGDKGPGKAVSYAFKYAILKTFVLETGDDPDQDQGVVHKPEVVKQENKEVLYPMLNKARVDSYIIEKSKLFNSSNAEFNEYLKVVSAMKEWDHSRTIYEFEKDPNAMATKFHAWVSIQRKNSKT